MRFLKYIWEVNPRDERKFCGYEIEDLWEEVLQTLGYKGERNFESNPDATKGVYDALHDRKSEFWLEYL